MQLQTVQEREESVARFVAAAFSIRRGCLRQRFLLHRKCRLEIDLRGFHPFVTEPQRNHGTIDACLQKVHGHGVPQAVNGDPFLFQRGAHSGRRCAMLVQQVLHAMDAETVTLALGNSTSPSPRCGSRSQAFNTATVDLAMGVQRSLRPLPMTRT